MKVEEIRKFCDGKAYEPNSFHGTRSCMKKSTVQRDGKNWCAVHDPLRVKERRANRARLYDEKYAKTRVWHNRQQGINNAHPIAVELAEATLKKFYHKTYLRELAAKFLKAAEVKNV